MGKNKLQKFDDMNSFSHVFQFPFSTLREKGFEMKGKWNSDFFKNNISSGSQTTDVNVLENVSHESSGSNNAVQAAGMKILNSLMSGDTFTGYVSQLNGDNAYITMNNGAQIQAKLMQGALINIGQNVTFMVEDLHHIDLAAVDKVQSLLKFASTGAGTADVDFLLGDDIGGQAGFLLGPAGQGDAASVGDQVEGLADSRVGAGAHRH